jgi:hypothetical protein
MPAPLKQTGDSFEKGFMDESKKKISVDDFTKISCQYFSAFFLKKC